VGTGAIAGPLVVCGVKAPKDWKMNGLKDSKQLSALRRRLIGDQLSKLIEDKTISFSISEKSNVYIDTVGVAIALKDAYVDVFHSLGNRQPILIIVDGKLKFDRPDLEVYTITTQVKADTTAPTVMAASILAKNYRDSLMRTWHELHPLYEWDDNVGYGSPKHIAAIRKYGLTPLHRRSYKVKSLSDIY
jgi:ribonuclease HII